MDKVHLCCSCEATILRQKKKINLKVLRNLKEAVKTMKPSNDFKYCFAGYGIHPPPEAQGSCYFTDCKINSVRFFEEGGYFSRFFWISKFWIFAG